MNFGEQSVKPDLITQLTDVIVFSLVAPLTVEEIILVIDQRHDAGPHFGPPIDGAHHHAQKAANAHGGTGPASRRTHTALIQRE